MTTIACDGKTMAGDGAGQIDDVLVSLNRVKVHHLSDGRVVGMAGSTHDGPAFREWLENGGKRPKCDSMGALVMSPDGTVRYFSERDDGDGVVVDTPVAVGSGRELALGAMLVGATPAAAVGVAASRDPFTGGTITVMCCNQ